MVQFSLKNLLPISKVYRILIDKLIIIGNLLLILKYYKHFHNLK